MENGLRPCHVLLKDIVIQTRLAIAESVDFNFAEILSEDSARMQNAIEKLKSFARHGLPKCNPVEEDLNNSRDSDVVIIDFEPAQSPKPEPSSVEQLAKKVAPKSVHKTPDRVPPYKPAPSSLPGEPFKRMTERQLIIETARQSPLLTSTPVRPESSQSANEEGAPRPGEVVEPQKKPKPNLAPTFQKLVPQNLPPKPVNGEVKKLKMKMKLPITPSSEQMKISGEKKSTFPKPETGKTPNADMPAQSSKSELRLKLKKVASPLDSTSAWLPKSPVKCSTNHQSNVEVAKARPKSPARNEFHNDLDVPKIPPFENGDLDEQTSPGNIFSRLNPALSDNKKPSSSQETRKNSISSSIEGLSQPLEEKHDSLKISHKSAFGSTASIESTGSCDVFQSEPASSAEKEKPISTIPSQGPKKHKIPVDKIQPLTEKKQKPSVSNDREGEDAEEDQLPDDPVLLKQKIAKKKEIIAGVKKKFKLEHDKLVANEKEVNDAKEKIKALENDLVSVRGQFLILAASRQGPESSVKKPESSSCECQCDLMTVRDDMTKLQQEIVGHLSVIEQLNNDVEETNSKLENSRSKIDTLTEENKELRKQNDSNRRLLHEAEKKCTSALATCESNKTEIAGLHRSIAKVNQHLKERDAKIAEMTAAAAEAATTTKETTPSLPVDIIAINESDSDLVKQLKREAFISRSECIEREELIDELRQEISVLENRKQLSSQIEDDLTEALTKNDNYEARISSLSSKNCKLESENGTLKMQLENAKEELWRAIVNRDIPLKAKECTYRNEMETLKRQIETMERGTVQPASQSS